MRQNLCVRALMTRCVHTTANQLSTITSLLTSESSCPQFQAHDKSTVSYSLFFFLSQYFPLTFRLTNRSSREFAIRVYPEVERDAQVHKS